MELHTESLKLRLKKIGRGDATAYNNVTARDALERIGDLEQSNRKQAEIIRAYSEDSSRIEWENSKMRKHISDKWWNTGWDAADFVPTHRKEWCDNLTVKDQLEKARARINEAILMLG
jgi:hypothetical protein